MNHDQLHDFARRYTAAWCSQNPKSVASFFAPDGSLAINGGPPSIGRTAITADARSFMTAFPDLEVSMDRLHIDGDRIEYHWTLKGTTNGNKVNISGFALWLLNAEGFIQTSLGHFDAADYQRQVSAKHE
ncbi:MAG: ester cyclase [Acidobacteria bacterium]|nr:ester cyclase [Acidobacteriota bacterium]